MKKLCMPTLFCHSLTVSAESSITGYNLRQPHAKKATVIALKSLNYSVIAFGDSYNDIEMLKEADTGILFCPSENVIKEFPELPVTLKYDELKALIEKELAEDKISS
jgi:phosphoserine/homoserine phosphotransferase